MKWVARSIAILLVLSLTVDMEALAEPFKDWFWNDPVAYENTTPIPGGDLVMRALHCGNNPADTSIPDGSRDFGNQGACEDRYESSIIFAMQAPPSSEDMAFIVGGLPGQYYCASSVLSTLYQSRSGCSNEVNFTVAPGQLGFVPNPPILSLQ